MEPDRLRAAQSDLLESLGTHIGTEADREALVKEVMGLAPLLAEPARDADVWKRRLEKIGAAARVLVRRLDELDPGDRKLLRYEAAGAGHSAQALADPDSLANLINDLKALEAGTSGALRSFPSTQPGRPTNDRARGIAHLMAGAYRKHIGALPKDADQSPFIRFLEVALEALGESRKSARRAASAVIQDMKAQEQIHKDRPAGES